MINNSVPIEDMRQIILIIDDSPSQLMSLGRILSQHYNIKMAKTGEEGLAIAAEGVNLIILDLFMPILSGFDTLRLLKRSEETKNIPVIFITGSVSHDDEAQGLALGAVDFIRKPFAEIVVKLRVEIHLRLVSQMSFIESLSLTDGLTGISNRRSFDQTIKTAWGIAKRDKGCFSLLMLDIDKFKDFNQKYGHLNGDICLKTVAAAMKSSLQRISDSVHRWGGEEFIIILPNTDLKGALIVAERIRRNIEATSIILDSTITSVTASMGVGTIFPDEADYETSLMAFATRVNMALFKAKEGGRNRVEVVPEG